MYAYKRYALNNTPVQYDVSAHSSLSKSVVIVLGLLERKMMMDNFPWATKMHFSVSEVSQAYSSIFNGSYQCRYYFIEYLYSQTSLKV